VGAEGLPIFPGHGLIKHLPEGQHMRQRVEAEAHLQNLAGAVEGGTIDLLEADLALRHRCRKLRDEEAGIEVVLAQIVNLERHDRVEVAPVLFEGQVLDVGVAEVAGDDIGADVVLRIAPDVPGTGG